MTRSPHDIRSTDSTGGGRWVGSGDESLWNHDDECVSTVKYAGELSPMSSSIRLWLCSFWAAGKNVRMIGRLYRRVNHEWTTVVLFLTITKNESEFCEILSGPVPPGVQKSVSGNETIVSIDFSWCFGVVGGDGGVGHCSERKLSNANRLICFWIGVCFRVGREMRWWLCCGWCKGIYVVTMKLHSRKHTK